MATKDKIVYVLTYEGFDGVVTNITMHEREEVCDWLRRVTEKSKHVAVSKENLTRGLILDMRFIK